jgi:peptidoglycan hydrolase CwlO-like protein
MRRKKILILLLFIALLTPFFSIKIFADTSATSSASSNPQAIQNLQNQIHDLEGKVTELQGQEKTLSSQIDVLDNQTQLTQLRIQSTKSQINELNSNIDTAENKISQLQGSVEQLSRALVKRIVATYETESTQTLAVLLTSKNVNDFLTRANYLRAVQEQDKKMMYNAVQAQNDYANQKDIYASKKEKLDQLNSQLQDYTDQLDQETNQRKTLLAQTQGSEANYQRLLAQAQAQLAGFSRFVTSQGGASLISGQTVCDDWGCYYNQRDTQWGGLALNGTQYSIASDGCLMTAMAMVYTHYGHRSVTPISINSNPSNFASYEPAWLNKTIVADGTTASRVSSSIDSELSGGRPVIVGISYDGGPYPDHFVVLISGSGGNYQMNDPYTANGHDIPFTSHYSVASIREIDRVSM